MIVVRFFHYFAAGAVIAAVAGCAATVAPQKLTTPSVPSEIRLEEAQTNDVSFAVSGAKHQYIVVAGTYSSVGEDAEGTYYLGPQACLQLKVLETGWGLPSDLKGKTTNTFDCGVFLPRNESLPARLFVVQGSVRSATTAQAGSGNSAVATGAVVAGTSTNPNIAPVQAGVGTGIGMGIVGGLIELDRGKFTDFEFPLDSAAIRKALRR